MISLLKTKTQSKKVNWFCKGQGKKMLEELLKGVEQDEEAK